MGYPKASQYLLVNFVRNLILPAQCLFCNRLGARICSNCNRQVGVDPRLVYREGRIGFSSDAYSDSAKRIIRAYKELGESELAVEIAEAMRPLLACFEEPPTLLVPIPSNQTSLRERGFNPAELLARELSSKVSGLRWANLLKRSRQTLDQSKLSPSQRQVNQSGSMVAQAGLGKVLIIDDVVTTGATIATATQVLENAGYFVQGFLTFAETEAKRV